MKRLAVARAALVVAALAGLGALVRAATVDARVPSSASAAPTPAGAEPVAHARALDAAAQAVIERNPFHPTRSPGEERAEWEEPEGEMSAPGVFPLRLVGLVTGTHPSALLEGVLPQGGVRVVQAGDTVAGWVVRRIAEAEVELEGPDSTVVLRIKEQGQ